MPTGSMMLTGPKHTLLLPQTSQVIIVETFAQMRRPAISSRANHALARTNNHSHINLSKQQRAKDTKLTES